MEHADSDGHLIAPWLGGKHVHTRTDVHRIVGPLPPAFGWYEWAAAPRSVTLVGPASGWHDALSGRTTITGYLIGDRLAPDGWAPSAGLSTFEHELSTLERVYLIRDDVPPIARISAARTWLAGELIFFSHELMPTDTPPALVYAFTMANDHQSRVNRVRATLAHTPTDISHVDFLVAAQQALTASGAELIHWKPRTQREYTITYRVDQERLQCVVDKTMHVVDPGVHFVSGAEVMLTELPSIIRQLMREDSLVQRRNV